MIPEVLVVDDSRSAAKGYADLIKLKANIAAVFTTSSSDAIAIIKEYPIKVLVLDQKMPQTTGTALFQQLQEVNPLVKAIMLTGEADADEIGEALRIGYSSYIHKSRVAELPGQVLIELLKYHTDVRANQRSEKMATVCSGFFRRTIIDIYYISSVVIDECYVDQKSWITAAEVKDQG
jgi:DNA-binding NtrC family response regulator